MRQNIFALLILLALTASSSGCKKGSIYVKRSLPETTIVPGDTRLASNSIHFSKDTVYVLGTFLTRDSGQSLSIEAGTVIKMMDRMLIAINPGATIDAKGTATEPIVFTTSAPEGTGGPVIRGGVFNDHYWYGLRIYGNPSNPAGPGSGTLSYVRIEFGGGDNNDGLAALTLQNVNKQTTLENIQVSYAYKNNSIEFSGGDCNARNLVAYASGGTDFYLHQGYKGMLQNLLAYRHPSFPGFGFGSGFSGLYISDAATLPLISNLTILGPDKTGISFDYSLAGAAALVITNGATFHMRNSIMLGFPKHAWYLDNTAVATALANGQSDLTYSVFHCPDSTKAFNLKPGTYGTATSADFKTFMLDPLLSNQLFLITDQFMLTDPFNYDVHPDPLPKTGSPLLTGANFDTPFNDAFFNKGSYRGALGTDNWLKDWTNFIPLQTNYNN